MNKREKEVFQAQLDSEKAVLKELEKQYQKALNDINRKIMILQSDELTQSRIYRIEYQKALKGQVEAVLDKLHGDEFTTIQQFLHDSYTDAFIGSVYDMHGQGVPLIMPIDQKAAVQAIQTDSKINEGLYNSLGVDSKKLKKTIANEITRGIAEGMSNNEIARNITNATKAPLSRSKTIARTESHRIQQASTFNAQQTAKKKGADVVKQWDSTMDGDTRPTHRRLDGQIRELDELFEMDGKKAKYPGGFGDPAEDCNCRCVSLQRARWALGEDELQTLKNRAEFFGLDKSKDFEDFKKKYLDINKDWSSADAELTEVFATDARDKIDNIVSRGTTKIKQGISAFSENDILYERVKKVVPDGNKFDVAMHGATTAVAFGGTEVNMSPRLLASVIRHSEGYNGQEIRLLSCSTGEVVEDGYCFAEELANALGVTVFAPNDLLFVSKSGKISIGKNGNGSFVSYKPNERKRLK